MKETLTTASDKINLIRELGELFSARARQHDTEGSFVSENYKALKENKYFSAMIPEELGGEGLTHADLCQIIRVTAHHCPSTALAFSMHQHLVAATIWRYRNKGEGLSLLNRVVNEQLVLVSTGAKDWLSSNGEMQKTAGGYLFSGKKHFASQSKEGDLAVTSAPYLDGKDWKVLHFGVSLKAPGVSLMDDWKVLGMRGTGSETIVFDKVFIPDGSISLERPRGDFHPVWNMILTVALPLIMAAYVGIAERAMEIVISATQQKQPDNDHKTYLIARIYNALLSVRTQWQAMIGLTNNLDFSPNEAITVDMLSYKTNISEAVRQIVSEAMDAIGGQSFYRSNELERLFRDVQAVRFHPLQAWEQYQFSGERLPHIFSKQ